MTDFDILKLLAGKALSQLVMMQQDLHLHLPAGATIKDYLRARSILRKTINTKKHGENKQNISPRRNPSKVY